MPADSTTYRNIQEICEMEKKALAHRSLSARIGDIIATHAGRMWFILVHGAWFGIWITINLKPRGVWTFDPFPFSL